MTPRETKTLSHIKRSFGNEIDIHFKTQKNLLWSVVNNLTKRVDDNKQEAIQIRI